MQLLIGNKNYSSWSMRPSVLMHALGLPFEEVRLRLDPSEGSAFRQAVDRVSPAGRVPVLVLDDGFAVWDTLAIVETLHDLFPAAGVWPVDARQRARARSVCAEMHSGFGALREHCPMNIEAHLPEAGERVWAEKPGVRRDVQRIEQLWADALQASGGPFLFGAFGAADAFFAPVAMRLLTYALPATPTSAAYIDRVARHPAVAAWCADARAEHDFLAEDEPYRSAR
jgi:glutathione S-transferase